MKRRTDLPDGVRTLFTARAYECIVCSLVLLALLCGVPGFGQQRLPLSFSFDKKYGQVEVGGPFAGVEFHDSRPLPSRISFYSPVANSIDLSKDYWKRGESRPMAIGIQIGSLPKKWIGREGWRYTLSPHTVTFANDDSLLSYRLSYDFCLTAPAMVLSLTLKNHSRAPQHVRAYTHLVMALRTCQTYARKDSAVMLSQTAPEAIVARFSDPDTKHSSVFVINAGAPAVRRWCDANILSVSDDGHSSWMDTLVKDDRGDGSAARRTRALAAHEYVKDLLPGESLTVTQIIGSAADDEAQKIITTLSTAWRAEVRAYGDFIVNKSSGETDFSTGDSRLDHSIDWAKALLAANAHYLEGQIVPMPCPAEYNFFFTHDLLMTNLGAVNFDLDRVKRNLLYVASLAKDSVIPHAYYWRDDGYKTEFCTPSNWNHLWFIEVSASYLRHSLDTAAVRRLYPLLVKSLSEVMTQLKGDHLMYAYRPDWWDIGWREGSRTYITTLSIRAIEDYLFIASMLDRTNPALTGLERTAAAMRSALTAVLWDDSLKYLINYNGPDKDTHFYMGSLLAPAYGLLDTLRSEELIRTAEQQLMAPGVGIRAAMPADFDTDSLMTYFKFAGDEAGKAYTYINGGVWPHNNAWYALALNAVGRSDDALAFVRKVMTVEGAAESMNGVPAMFEYRFSDASSPRYGEIDKPSFLWAGGFYLYTMYTLAGMADSPWNLAVSDHHARFGPSARLTYTFGTAKKVSLKGTGGRPATLAADGKSVPSLVLPLEQRRAQTLSVTFDRLAAPYLESANAIVHAVRSRRNGTAIDCAVSSFAGHATTLSFLSVKTPGAVFLNQRPLPNVENEKKSDGRIASTVRFTAGASIDTVTITW
jgi:hypothetical protein